MKNSIVTPSQLTELQAGAEGGGGEAAAAPVRPKVEEEEQENRKPKKTNKSRAAKSVEETSDKHIQLALIAIALSEFVHFGCVFYDAVI